MLLIDARYLTERLSGIERYTLNLLTGLARIDTPMPVAALVPPRVELPGELARTTRLKLIEAPGNPRRPGDQVAVLQLLRKLRPRLVHSLDAFAPLAAPCPVLITIYDLIPIELRRLLPASRKARLWRAWKCWLQLQCRRSCGVVTISRHAAGAIGRRLSVRPHRIAVATPGIEPVGEVAADAAAAVRARFGLSDGERFVLYTGRMETYKCVDRLVEAFARVRDRAAGPLRLVLAGNDDPRFVHVRAAIERTQLGDAAVVTGYVDEPTLAALYRSADLFVFPSLAEGFGLPPLEAMSAGTPVVASNHTAVPEAVGDAAVLVDPRDDDALAAAMARVLGNADLAARLTEAGRARAALFTPAAQAAATVAIYQRALDARPVGLSDAS